MRDLNDYYYFVKVVEFGGFAPAGRALCLPKSKLSRRIAGLEETLGVKLIYRSTRQFTVTEIGQTFLMHCRAMLIEADAAQEVIEFIQAEPSGIIKVSCPIALINAHIANAIAGYMQQYPKVTVHLEATNRRVDLVAEGVDVAIRVRPAPLEDSELILKILSERSLSLVASSALVKLQKAPKTPTDLSHWPSLGLGELQHQYHWQLYGPNKESVMVRHTPRLVTTDMMALREAALAGIGIVQLPALIVSEQLKEGTLMEVLPQWQCNKDIIHLVYPSRRGLLPSVRSLIDYLADYYQSFDEI